MDEEARDPARLEVILVLIARARKRIAALTIERFVEDDDEIDLLAYRLAMLGETASKLSPELRARYPHIPWKQMYGLRNMIAHEYMRVTPTRIWHTATVELEAIEAVCRTELARLAP